MEDKGDSLGPIFNFDENGLSQKLILFRVNILEETA
jgi:hypothetical protein